MSCVRWVHTKIPSAPLVDAEHYAGFPRSMPTVGSVAIFEYLSGVSHVAIVESLGLSGFTVSECNYFGDGTCGRRFVDYNHYSIVGFWTPNPMPYLAIAMATRSLI